MNEDNSNWHCRVYRVNPGGLNPAQRSIGNQGILGVGGRITIFPREKHTSWLSITEWSSPKTYIQLTLYKLTVYINTQYIIYKHIIHTYTYMYITINEKHRPWIWKREFIWRKRYITFSKKMKIIDVHHVSSFYTPTVWYDSQYSRFCLIYFNQLKWFIFLHLHVVNLRTNQVK